MHTCKACQRQKAKRQLSINQDTLDIYCSPMVPGCNLELRPDPNTLIPLTSNSSKLFQKFPQLEEIGNKVLSFRPKVSNIPFLIKYANHYKIKSKHELLAHLVEYVQNHHEELPNDLNNPFTKKKQTKTVKRQYESNPFAKPKDPNAPTQPTQPNTTTDNNDDNGGGLVI